MNPMNVWFRTCSYKRFSLKTNYLEILYAFKMSRGTQSLSTQRVKIKEKSQKYSPGTVQLQVLGSGAPGAPRSLYLFTDQSRYLFNCGEGSQRLAHEHKMKLSKLEHIFITYKSWDNLGGLPGVALTLQDVGIPQLVLHGPDSIEDIFTATSRFIVLKNLSIKKWTGMEYEDNAIKVRCVALSAKTTRPPAPPVHSDQDVSEDETDYYDYDNSVSGKRARRVSVSVEPGGKRQSLSEDVAMCYVVRLQPKAGALCLERCVQAGVPPGPLLGLLKSGQDVHLQSGQIVRSQDVTLPHDPGPIFLVVEVPDERFLPSLQDSFSRYQTAASEEETPYLVCHFTPSRVMDHPQYREWMGRFSLSTHHLLLNDSNSCMGSVAVHRLQHKLNLLQPDIFPLLNDPGFSSQDQSKTKVGSNFECPTIEGRTNMKINLRPKKGSILSSVEPPLKIEPEAYRQEVLSLEEFPTTLAEMEARVARLGPRAASPEYPHLIFLGTGSCIPNKVRNTSGILLTLSEECRMVLDCGEGTLGQLVRYFGPSESTRVLSSLRAVYISHLHADHHLGLVGLLKARPPTAPPLYLLAPPQIMTWLRFFHDQLEPILDRVKLVSNVDLLWKKGVCGRLWMEPLLSSLQMSAIRTTYVRHCPNAFGVCLSSATGWRLTYSGDTMPSQDLITLGEECELLIHEATMEDDLGREARAKMHCTTSEAVEVGRAMKARFTLLTHFSQRYAKLPRIQGEGLGETVGVAFDNMKVGLSDLPKLSCLYPALKLIFREDCEELELKALKRQLKEERDHIIQSLR